MTESPRSDFTSGPMIASANPLDVAIQGEGFFAVQAADGTEAYTRAGNFVVDETGMLRTANGLPVLGANGPINIPENKIVQVGSDGTISMVGQDQGPEALVEVGRLKLVNPDVLALEKGDDGLFRQRDGLDALPAAEVMVRGNMVEGSNVNAIDEFTQILSLARQYEMQVKVMKTAEENSASSAQLLQMS